MTVWLQVSAGRGPAECAWVVPRVARSIIRDAAAHATKVEVLDSVPGRMPKTLDSVLLSLTGGNLDILQKAWVGTILWVGQSPFRPHQRRKNWFVGVQALAVPVQPAWSEKDLHFRTMRSSGPGGQHVNKTESAVRVTHLPTGLAVTAREERSQAANRRLALARLAGLMEKQLRASEQAGRQERWAQHDRLERGNPVRVFRGPDFVSDSVP